MIIESSQKPNATSERRLELCVSKVTRVFRPDGRLLGRGSSSEQRPAYATRMISVKPTRQKEKLSAKINRLPVGLPSDRNICKLRGRI
ncbi:hypothetical protein [Sinorhizobium fredii]|uniref:hypothetical protein n=1 Tax=Rhizobium fredii TaxID=380 RepID=UPI0013E8EDFE|nr:hypothetical protein [Sinorhizobium fredii]